MHPGPPETFLKNLAFPHLLTFLICGSQQLFTQPQWLLCLVQRSGDFPRWPLGIEQLSNQAQMDHHLYEKAVKKCSQKDWAGIHKKPQTQFQTQTQSQSQTQTQSYISIYSKFKP